MLGECSPMIFLPGVQFITTIGSGGWTEPGKGFTILCVNKYAKAKERMRNPVLESSQSVKTTEKWGIVVAGKKLKGRKWHILVDTLGLILLVVVHAAHIQERDGVLFVLVRAYEKFLSLKLI